MLTKRLGPIGLTSILLAACSGDDFQGASATSGASSDQADTGADISADQWSESSVDASQDTSLPPQDSENPDIVEEPAPADVTEEPLGAFIGFDKTAPLVFGAQWLFSRKYDIIRVVNNSTTTSTGPIN